MHSLRTKIVMMAVIMIVAVVLVVTVTSVLFIRNTEHRKSDQLLLLLCETGERNLDYYFTSVEKSVKKMASYTEKDLDGLEDEKLAAHTKRVESYFEEVANKTNGVLTYYYRIDPAVSSTVKGFWYTNLDGTDFIEHEVTDISQYDTEDTSKLVWFTVPKHNGTPIWLPPYITDNLDVRVISYNMPITYRGEFVGVIGIELDYTMMAEQVGSIRLYNNGYAFLTEADGRLIYHPRMDIATMAEKDKPSISVRSPKPLCRSVASRTSEPRRGPGGIWISSKSSLRVRSAPAANPRSPPSGTGSGTGPHPHWALPRRR